MNVQLGEVNEGGWVLHIVANMTNACVRVIQKSQGVGTILILFGFGSGGKTAWRLTRQSWQKLERKLNLVRLNRASHISLSL